MRRPHGALAWAELALALLITALIVSLNLRFATQAGPLWRDEVSTVQLATRSTYTEVLRSLSLDSAPALYPTLLRLWSSPWSDGGQDVALRVLGFGVAAAMVGAIWVTGRALAAGPPLLALTVFATHAGTLQTAGSVKPYGLGSLFIVLAFGAHALLVRSNEMVTEGSWPLVALWAVAAGLVSYGVVRTLRRSSRGEPTSGPHVLYAALVIVAATSLHLGFLKLAGRVPQAWQFVPLIAVVALAIDVVLGGTRSLRWARAGVAVLATALAFPVSTDRVGIRQTNVDLIAQYVHTAAQPGDLILVNPWYVGITFNRYYRGPVPWMTLPPMEDLTVNRYDLLKLRMTSAEPLAPLYGAIQGALESRHRVWLVGGLLFPPAGHVPPVLPPAPGLPTGWSDGPYTIGWALQTGYFVQTHAERLAFDHQQSHALQVVHGACDGNSDNGQTLGMRLHEVAGLQRPPDRVGSVAPSRGEAGCGRENGRDVSGGREEEDAHQPDPEPGLKRRLECTVPG